MVFSQFRSRIYSSALIPDPEGFSPLAPHPNYSVPEKESVLSSCTVAVAVGFSPEAHKRNQLNATKSRVLFKKNAANGRVREQNLWL